MDVRSGSLIITADTYYPAISGAARFTRELAEGMSRRGHRVHLVVPSWRGAPLTTVRAGVAVHGIRSHRPLPGRPNFWVSGRRASTELLTDLIYRAQPRLLHINGHLLIGRAATAVAGRRGLPVIATNHFMPDNLVNEFRLPPAVRRLAARALWVDTGRVLRRVTAVTAPTATAVRLMAAEANVPSAIPISCGVDLSRFATITGSARPGTRILYVGRLDREKRVDDLLKALSHLDGAGLDVVGTGRESSALQALAARLGIADRVRFRGEVGDAEVRQAYAEADVFCMPGIAELQSIATLEALAAGLPVVGANAAALPHLVRDGVTGWLYPPGDTAALAHRLARLLADPAQRAEMGRAGRDLAAQHELESTLDRYEAVYREVLRPARTPA